jgi:hypothetical protein
MRRHCITYFISSHGRWRCLCLINFRMSYVNYYCHKWRLCGLAHLKTERDPVSETLCSLDICHSGRWTKSTNPVNLNTVTTSKYHKLRTMNFTESWNKRTGGFSPEHEQTIGWSEPSPSHGAVSSAFHIRSWLSTKLSKGANLRLRLRRRWKRTKREE